MSLESIESIQHLVDSRLRLVIIAREEPQTNQTEFNMIITITYSDMLLVEDDDQLGYFNNLCTVFAI